MGRSFLCGLSCVADYPCLTDDVHFDFSGVTELRFDGGRDSAGEGSGL